VASAPKRAVPSTAQRDAELGIKELHDVRAMRAITHPVRLARLRVLAEERSLTATAAGELIGQTVTTCSFHFRQLAKYGFVEEGERQGRNRPWKLTHTGMRFSTTRAAGPEEKVAATALARLWRDEQFARLETWMRTREDYPRAWREAAASVQMNLYLTADELAELEDAVLSLFLPRFQDRADDPRRRPEGSTPVEALFFAYPTRLPAGVAPRRRGQRRS